MSVQISAIICTHNRAEYLRKALRSLVDQTLPRELYEIIVVDNASEDNTKEVVGEFSEVPNLRYIYEPAVGVSRARNTGWQNAQGEYVALLDDDAVASPEWLEKCLEVIETFEPRPGAVGGRVAPIWEAPKPDWLSNRTAGLALLDWSEVPIILNEQQWLLGCNVAYPRTVLEAAGGFREDLGRKGNTLRAHGESCLRLYMISRGLCRVYHPEIVVQHHVPAKRMTKRWFRQRVYWQGRSDAILLYPATHLSFARRLGLTLGKIGWMLPRLGIMFITIDPATRFWRQRQVLDSIGFIIGLWLKEPESLSQ